MQEDSEMTTEISQFLVFMSSPNSQAMPISAAGNYRHILRKLLKFSVPRVSGLVPAIHGLRNSHSPQMSPPSPKHVFDRVAAIERASVIPDIRGRAANNRSSIGSERGARTFSLSRERDFKKVLEASRSQQSLGDHPELVRGACRRCCTPQ